MILLISSIFFALSTIQNSGLSNTNLHVFNDTCRKGKDTVTGRVIYLTADVVPEYEGGKVALMRRINRGIKLSDSVLTNDIQSNYIVGFIVEADGQITGERVIQDNTNQIGKQLLSVIKSFRWNPAKCNGKKVAMLYKYPIIVDFQTN